MSSPNWLGLLQINAFDRQIGVDYVWSSNIEVSDEATNVTDLRLTQVERTLT